MWKKYYRPVTTTDDNEPSDIIISAAIQHPAQLDTISLPLHLTKSRHNIIIDKTESLEIEGYSLEVVYEITAVKININKKKSLCLLGVYRPPRADLDTSLQVLLDVLDSLLTQRTDTLIVGDINIDNFDKVSENRHKRKSVLEKISLNALLAGYNIRRLDLPATRISETSVSSFDVVCSNLHKDKTEVVVYHTGLSDHTGQYCLKAKTNFSY
ncbi:hypothetical protein J6590_064811 [Homalodisca vitripennis]|nr:hypothetical protein J6590_064811 [Homalodisca vitripennis]